MRRKFRKKQDFKETYTFYREIKEGEISCKDMISKTKHLFSLKLPMLVRSHQIVLLVKGLDKIRSFHFSAILNIKNTVR